MAYVICQPCDKCAVCAAACQYGAIHPLASEGDFSTVDQLFIDPARCIDCGDCGAVCPNQIIFAADEVPADMESYVAKNALYFGGKAAVCLKRGPAGKNGDSGSW